MKTGKGVRTIRSLLRMIVAIYGVVVVLSFLTTPTTAVFQTTATVETTIRIDMNKDQPSSAQAESSEPLESEVQTSSEANENETVEELGEKE